MVGPSVSVARSVSLLAPRWLPPPPGAGCRCSVVLRPLRRLAMEFTHKRGKRQDDSGLGSVLDVLLANARLVLGVSGAAVLAIATLAVKRVRMVGGFGMGLPGLPGYITRRQAVGLRPQTLCPLCCFIYGVWGVVSLPGRCLRSYSYLDTSMFSL